MHRSGRVPGLGDALIAGAAKARNLSLATRNVRDFDGLDVDVTNPWETRRGSIARAGSDTGLDQSAGRPDGTAGRSFDRS